MVMRTNEKITPVVPEDWEQDVKTVEDFNTPTVDTSADISETVADDLATQTVLLTGSEDPVIDQEDVSQTLLETGTHPKKEAVEAAIEVEQNNRVVEVASVLSYEGADSQSIMKVALDRINDMNDKSMPTVISHNAIDTYEPPTKTAADVFKNWGEGVADEEVESYGQLKNIVAEEHNNYSLSWGLAGEALLTLVPFYEGKALQELGKEFLDGGGKAFIAPGEIIEAMRNKANFLSPEEKVEFYRDVSLFLKENAGLVGGNEFVRINALTAIFDEAVGNTAPEDMDWERWGLNFGGLLDLAIVVGPAAKGINKIFKAARSSTFSRVATANPEKGADLAKIIAKNPERTKAVGDTAESFRAKVVLPKADGWSTASTPEVVRQAVKGVDDIADEVLSISTRIDQFVDKEGIELASDIQKTMQKSAGNSVWVADTSLNRTKTGWNVKALVGQSDHSGWGSVDAVTKANKELFEGNAKVLSRVNKSDDLVEGTVEGATEWFLRSDHSSKIGFTDDDFGIVLGTKFRRYLTDADTQFAKTISSKGNALFDQYKLLEKTLEGKFVKLAELKNDGKLAVSTLLSRGLQNERFYTPTEIKRLLTSQLGYKGKQVDEVVGAYNDARKGFDTMYLLENNIFTKGLIQDGFEGVFKHGDETVDFARAMSDDAAKAVKRVYNPVTKTIEDAPNAKDGIKFFELRSPVKMDGEQTRFVFKSKGADITELPQFTLNYREGWLPTRYKENYFIIEKSTVLDNGAKVPSNRVLGVAKTKPEADAWVVRLTENAEDGVTYSRKHDRTLAAADAERMSGEVNKSHGKLFFSKKGERLKFEDGSLARIQDPLESAVNSIRTVARRTAMDGFISDLKTRYVNTYGDLTKGVFIKPAALEDLTDPRLVKADAMFNHINHLEGFGGTAFNEQMRLIHLSEKLDSWGLPRIAEGARWMSDKTDIIGAVRAKNFEFNLGTDPLRQMLLQPTQLLFTAALDPVNVWKNINGGRIISGLIKDPYWVKNASVEDFNKIARLQGLRMSGDELMSLTKEYIKSGLGEAVTSHQIARDAASSLSLKASGGPVERALGTVGQLYSKPVGVLGKGFNRGEEINLGGHWMMSRARYLRNNPGADPAKHILEIAGEARSMALSMTSAGDLAYSKGFMSWPMQYFSIRHKTLMAMTTNQTFTKAEKFRLALGQALQWGPEGLALGGVADWMAREYGLSMPEWMRDGVTETFLNSVLSEATDTEVDLDFAGSFGILQGVLSDNLVSGMYDLVVNGGDVSDIAFGASASNLNRVSNFADSFGIFLNTDLGKAGGADMSLITAEDFLSMASSYNRLAQGYAMVKSGHWQNSRGQDVLPASVVEAGLHGFLGLQSNRVDNLYELQKAISPVGTFRQTALQETADDYYRVALQITNQNLSLLENGEPYSDVVARHKALMATNNIMVANLGPDADIVMKMVREKMGRGSKKTKVDELTSKLSKLYLHKGNLNYIEFAKDQKLISEEEADTYTKIHNYMWEK